MGLLAGLRLLAVRPRVRGLHGRLLLRPEALPPLDDADLGGHRAPLAEHAHRSRGAPSRQHPTGSLGIAISEAVEVAASREDTNYALGSVLNHVLLHQTVIGQEAQAQMELAGEQPDVVIACVGGGSNFGGLAFPFMREVLRGDAKTRFVAAEPSACPTLTRGSYRYDFGDTAGLTPLMPMYTLGHDFVPPPVHAGGLRYHGDSPMVSALVRAGVVEPRAYRQNETFAAAVRFARSEGIIPAPEPAHAIRAVIEEADAAREAGEPRVILFGLCGHGHFDLSAYDAFLAGELEDPEFSEQEMADALAGPAADARDRLRPPAAAPGPARAAGRLAGRVGICRAVCPAVVLLASMPRAMWTGAISFGLVSVPVKLYSALDRKTVRFHQLSGKSGVRIAQKRVDPQSGEEVPYEDIVKGFEITPERYVRDRARRARRAGAEEVAHDRDRGVRRAGRRSTRSTTTTPTTSHPAPAAPSPTGCCTRRCARPAKWRSRGW